MKLSSKDIAAIEGLIDKATASASLAETAAYYGLGKHGMQALSTTLVTLRRIGVAIPQRQSISERKKAEWAEFREWQRAKAAEAARPTLLRRDANGSLSPHY